MVIRLKSYTLTPLRASPHKSAGLLETCSYSFVIGPFIAMRLYQAIDILITQPLVVNIICNLLPVYAIDDVNNYEAA